MKKKSFRIIAVLCLALLFTATIVACTGDGDTDETLGNTDVTPGGDDVTPGGDDTGITPEGEFTFTDLGNDQWSVAKYNGNRAHVVIPSTYKGGAVVAIGDEAFSYCLELTSVTIGDSVTTIGEFAFGGCIGLTSITVGRSVTAIGEYAFEACCKLVEIYNKSNLNLTAGSDDYGGIGLCAKNIYTEENESKLTFTDDGYIFYYNGTDAYLMGYCGDERALTLPDGFTAYDGTQINSYEIHQYAFSICEVLTSVVIPDSVTTIKEYAFGHCIGLTSVTIGESVTTIEDSAFNGCHKLIEVYNKSKLEITAGSWDNSFVGFFAKNVYSEEGGSKLSYTDDGYIFYYDGTDAYLMGYYGDETELTLPDSFTANDGSELNSYKIYQNAFYSCDELTSVAISDSVTAIGDSAFHGCAGLISVTIPDSVTSIGSAAFHDCVELTSVLIPGSVTTIGDFAFDGCTGLTSVTIGESVTTIGALTFTNCNNLTSVTFKDTEGWQVSDSESFDAYTALSAADLADPDTAAQYMTGHYNRHYWRKV